MAHLVVNDAGRLGIQLLARAQAHGHRVVFLASKHLQLYRLDDVAQKVLAGLEQTVVVDTTDPNEVKSVLRHIQNARSIDAIICGNAFAIEATAQAAKELGIRFTALDRVQMCQDKAAVRAALERESIPSARYAVAGSLVDVPRVIGSIGLPAVIKPTKSSGGRLARVVRRFTDVPEALTSIQEERRALPDILRTYIADSFLVEEYLAGPLLSVEIGLRDGRFFVFVVTEVLRPLDRETTELGVIMPARLPVDDSGRCSDNAKDVVRALGLDIGIFHLEIVLTAGGPRLVEANPRMMGHSLPSVYDLLTGEFYYDRVLEMWLGQEVRVPSWSYGRTVLNLDLRAKRSGRVELRSDVPATTSQPQFVEHCDVHVSDGDSVRVGDLLGCVTLVMEDPSLAPAILKRSLMRLEESMGLPLARVDLHGVMGGEK